MDKERRKQLKLDARKLLAEERAKLDERLKKENPYELSDPRWAQTMLDKYQKARAYRRGERIEPAASQLTKAPASSTDAGTVNLLPTSATDLQIISLIDRWVAYLEREDYVSAYGLTEHNPDMGWSPELMRELIKAYGDQAPAQKVTLYGKATDRVQRKEVNRFADIRDGRLGYVWYDLNIDGYRSDLTATFDIRVSGSVLTVTLDDIHVM
jgi:hypothetical protein